MTQPWGFGDLVDSDVVTPFVHNHDANAELSHIHNAVQTVCLVPSSAEWVARPCPPRDASLQGAANSPFERFLLALLVADWASYPRGADRITPDRLRRMVTDYPSGFWAYFAQFNGEWLPVGYFGFYPAANWLLETLVSNERRELGRADILPFGESGHQGLYYLANYSAAPNWIGSPLAKNLLLRLRCAVNEQSPSFVCAVAVSGHGERVARRFGMVPATHVVITSGTTNGPGTLDRGEGERENHDELCKPETLFWGPWASQYTKSASL